MCRKMYVTGGLGTAQYRDEGFGDPYLLPNRTYCESCASIAHVFWQHRMNLLRARPSTPTSWNWCSTTRRSPGCRSAGDGSSTRTRLASNGGQRSSWIGLACCPTNLARFIPQVGGFVYARREEKVYVNLYRGRRGDDRTGRRHDRSNCIKTTNYPWDGRVELTVNPQGRRRIRPLPPHSRLGAGPPVPSDLYRFADAKVRAGHTEGQRPAGRCHAGKTTATCIWHASLASRRHGGTRTADAGPPRLRPREGRGGPRQGGPDARAGRLLPRSGRSSQTSTSLVWSCRNNAPLRAEHHPEVLGGVTVLRGRALTDGQQPVALTAVPYYAWCNREKGPMTVWINESPAEDE